MKIQMFRVWALGVAIVSLALATGCEEEQARAEVPDAAQLVPELAPTDSTPLLANLEAAPTPIFVGAAAAAETNVSTNVAMPKLVAKPVMPAELKVTPALAEVLKLAQAGVSDDVMLAYIVHSTNFFDVNSDVIVYLNDLGVSNNVITTLIHHDSTPEMQARRQAAVAVQPLPANVVLNTPATNVYPPAVPQTVFAPAPDSAAVPPPPVDAEVAQVSAPEDPVSVSHFYSSLAPYGTWVEVDGYGLAWQPTVVVSNPGWRPYCDRGRWIWTDCGWYWYSDYSWGWAPFHYGRWCDYPRLGWLWVPDTHWGPSWVSWRYSSSYCGWAPLPPDCHYRPGFGFSYYGSSIGFSFGFDFGLSFHHYSYVPFNRFCDRSPGLHVLRGDRARVIHRETTVVNNYVVGDNNTIINRGIGRERVASANRGQVPTARVRETPTRASTRREQLVKDGSSLAIVRPTLPPRPERSQVAVPPRSGIARVSSSDSQGASPRSSSVGGTPSTYTRPSVSRGNSAVVRDASPPASAATEPARANSTVAPRRGGAPSVVNRGEATATAPATRSLSPAFRSYARPGNERTETTPQVAATPAPSPSRSSVSRLQSSPSAPVATIPAPAVPRPAAPTYTRPSAPPATAPRPATRNDSVRSYARPNAVSPPQVSRPSPSVSAPARPSYSRPEPSRSAPSYTPPPARSAPSFSPPARSAPSVSPSPSRSSPSYSRPSGGFSGGGRSQGRSRGGD